MEDTPFPYSGASLAQHYSARLLWLPLTTCVKMTGLHNLTPRLSATKGISGPQTDRTPRSTAAQRVATLVNNKLCSGFEEKVKAAIQASSPIPMSKLRNSFGTGKAADNYVESANLCLRLEEEFGSSQWENMELFRRVGAVIVVFVTTAWESSQLSAITGAIVDLFEAQFRDRVCRCLVVDPEPDLEPFLRRPCFVKCDGCTPLGTVVDDLLTEMGSAVVADLNKEYLSYAEASSNHIVAVRTPLDRVANNDSFKKQVIASRLLKKQGDLLVLLGAHEKALRCYGETQFASNTDSTWCASTLEAIAAVRFQQLRAKLQSVPHVNETLSKLQSDATQWNGSLTPLVEDLEKLFCRFSADMKKVLYCFKGYAVPSSMRQRLSKEVDEVLDEKSKWLSELTKTAHACIAAKTTHLPDVHRSYYVGKDIKQCIEGIVSCCLHEIEVYLRESLRQLRHTKDSLEGFPSASMVMNSNIGIIYERILECRLKFLAFYSEQGNRDQFLQEMADIRNSFCITNEKETHEHLLLYFVYLCVRCDCRRTAVALLVEIEHENRRASNYHAAVLHLLQAALLSRIDIGSIPSFTDAPYKSKFHLVRASTFFWAPTTEAAGGNDVAGVHRLSDRLKEKAALLEERTPDRGSNRAAEEALKKETHPSHILLLMELLDLLAECGCENGSRCHVATFLLFRYSHLLKRSVQEFLMFVASRDAAFLRPGCPSPVTSVFFFSTWEALPLPPHLAPKTMSVSGPLFTFIDTSRLKLTILSLNGKRLLSRVVWTVGDVCSVRLILTNPLKNELWIDSLGLHCSSCSALNEDNSIPADAVVHSAGPLAPTCYALEHIHLAPLERVQIVLNVQPEMEGYIRIHGVQLSLQKLLGSIPLVLPLPEAIGVPVLQRLPLVSCTVSTSELEIFSGQRVNFSVRVVNCGHVPIERISLTAHNETCMLEDCQGCMERINKKECTVFLSKASLDAASRVPLQPGDVVTIPVYVQAPATIEDTSSNYVVFRVDCSLPYERPIMPPNVPPAVPVFGVIPRRVMETRMRLFQAPTLSVTSITLTRDRRFVDIRISNASTRYSVDLYLSSIGFADLPNALLVPGAAYVVPPIEVSCVPEDMYQCHVQWSIRELPHCVGELPLDLSIIANEGVCTEPLDECKLEVEIEPTSTALYPHQVQRWQTRRASAKNSTLHTPSNGLYTNKTANTVAFKCEQHVEVNASDDNDEAYEHGAGGNDEPLYIPAVQPVSMKVTATARWQRAVPLRFQLSMDHHFDVGVLTGPVDTRSLVGELEKHSYQQRFDLVAFKTGFHVVSITITDLQGREITHEVPVHVKHPRA
ncbi:hypothetical protein STCU_09418 [Strigomonas culicis]|uniref:Uncharacterized protein n=1 Tax=Strigomonas culicis TaxID=28005 RepID=S9TSM4_9TRYP|nr:hypothetical protein STCU_09418 [Strigomonas culicis]|eukprot:EPY19503.1 hypothetical protein STCU_09418 [Strigomonas culicis]